MHEIVKYFILTEIRYKTVNFRSRSDRGNLPRDLAHSRCMEQCMVADLSAGLGTTVASIRSRSMGHNCTGILGYCTVLVHCTLLYCTSISVQYSQNGARLVSPSRPTLS